MSDREEITIQGVDFTIATRYAEGHTLTANEAAALNQMRAENIANNFRSKIKAAIEANDLDVDALQAELDAYADTYEFGLRRTATPKDPVAAKALSLAKAAIRAAIQAQGKKVRDFAPEAIEDAAIRLLNTPKGEEIREMARARLAEEKAAANVALTSLPV